MRAAPWLALIAFSSGAFTLVAEPAAAQVSDSAIYATAADTGHVARDADAQPRRPAVRSTPRPRRFSVSAEIGGLFGTNATRSTGGLPPVGDNNFTTFTGLPTRAVPSWYFGDGPSLFNENAGFRGRSATMTALDPMMVASSVRRDAGLGAGASLEYDATPRVTIGADVMFGIDHLSFTNAAKGAVTATSQSFEGAFEGLFNASTLPLTAFSATSTPTFVDHAGGELVATGTITLHLSTRGRWRPYVVGGLGVVSGIGGPASLTLSGVYSFTVAGAPAGIHETDAVALRFVTSSKIAGVFGVGLEHPLSALTSLRFDARFMLSGNATTVDLDATPSTTPEPESSQTVVVFGGAPALQFSTLTNGGPNLLSSLSGKALTNVLISSATGTRLETAVTFCLVRRF